MNFIHASEINGLKKHKKCDCGSIANLQVCCSAGGFYLGFWCAECGPISRETYYMKTRSVAERELEKVLEGDGTEFERIV